ncbi:hypothetical protein D3C78_1281070 [compost metagenome]
MHRQNRLGPWGNCPANLLRVKAPTVGQHVDEHRCRTQIGDGRSRGDPVGIGEDHLIAGTDAQRRHAHVQRAGATGRCNRVGRTHVLGKGLFEACQVLVAALSPTMADGIEYVVSFQLTDTGLGVMNSAHRMINSGMAMTKRPSHARMPAKAWVISSSRFHGSTST